LGFGPGKKRGRSKGGSTRNGNGGALGGSGNLHRLGEASKNGLGESNGGAQKGALSLSRGGCWEGKNKKRRCTKKRKKGKRRDFKVTTISRQTQKNSEQNPQGTKACIKGAFPPRLLEHRKKNTCWNKKNKQPLGKTPYGLL